MGVYSARLPGKERNKHSKFSVYDLVAGRIRRPKWDFSGTDAIEGVNPALSPEDYLLRRHQTLDSYPFEEHRDLPDPSLVTAIHWYIAQRLKEMNRNDLFEIYDGTSLLAIAVELEEQIKASLGENGHLLFAQKKDGSSDTDDSNVDINTIVYDEDHGVTDDGDDGSNDMDSEDDNENVDEDGSGENKESRLADNENECNDEKSDSNGDSDRI